MTRDLAGYWLSSHGYPSLSVDKAEGVWYIVGGGDDPRIDQSVERCLHIVRLADLTPVVLRSKLDELTEAHRMETANSAPAPVDVLATIRRHAEAHRALASSDDYSAQEAPRLEAARDAIAKLVEVSDGAMVALANHADPVLRSLGRELAVARAAFGPVVHRAGGA